MSAVILMALIDGCFVSTSIENCFLIGLKGLKHTEPLLLQAQLGVCFNSFIFLIFTLTTMFLLRFSICKVKNVV